MKILILSHCHWNNSFKTLSYGLKREFIAAGCDCEVMPYTEKDFPMADYVIGIYYEGDITEDNIWFFRTRTGCKNIYSVRESPCRFVDHSFVFNPEYRRGTVIELPADKTILKPTEKKPRTILLDHYWQQYLGTEKDWTQRIESWLWELEGYTVYRLLRWTPEIDHIESYEIPIHYTTYEDYLDRTKDVETYIITHQESYGYGLIDMACRGTRVCAPPDFIKSSIVEKLQIPIFHNKEELLDIIRSQVEPYWQHSADQCTGYDEMVKIILEYMT